MRILHTGDWHLGKLFYGSYLTEEQAYVLFEQFIPMVRDMEPDVIILAGDVYDRSLPPAEAVVLFDEVLTKIVHELKVPLIVISGNHDSAERLSFGSRLLAAQGLHLIGDLAHTMRPIELDDEFGPVSFVPIPYVEPAAVRHYLGRESIMDPQSALNALLRSQQVLVPPGQRKVAIAHVFAAGGVTSESERPLSIGGTEVVDSTVFDGFSYAALGHLHGPQQVGSDRVRYAGSLLKYSFGEASQKKGISLIELGKDGTIQHERLPFTPRHDVRVISGNFQDLLAADDRHQDDYILARLSDTTPVLDGLGRLRSKYPRIMALETPNRVLAADSNRFVNFKKVTEADMFQTFVENMRGTSLSSAEETYMTDIWRRLWQGEGQQ